MTRTLAVARSALLALASLIVGVVGGCSPADPPTLSPTPEQDPKRNEQVRAADLKADQQNQVAARLLKKKRRAPLPAK